ncbi:uncharacterized protein B0I36DRAFT_393341 [Microdochium trichocladiopsis]|uniref:Zn(2)-C6 fungal-type domain-containing protein n=1 Tax=Microdochium trichocladiopsis TaxID=1682393 RepID=A0A9P9BKX7_9PEZI|nr:uncharacterized protein B0I36DRAFT_393341 [Microdochium trichocladiopsis]KAH7021072.1 hypothetical protein B0I36DRAFT_393341 [Microdochium trichocladiopsis]
MDYSRGWSAQMQPNLSQRTRLQNSSSSGRPVSRSGLLPYGPISTPLSGIPPHMPQGSGRPYPGGYLGPNYPYQAAAWPQPAVQQPMPLMSPSQYSMPSGNPYPVANHWGFPVQAYLPPSQQIVHGTQPGSQINLNSQDEASLSVMAGLSSVDSSIDQYFSSMGAAPNSTGSILNAGRGLALGTPVQAQSLQPQPPQSSLDQTDGSSSSSAPQPFRITGPVEGLSLHNSNDSNNNSNGAHEPQKTVQTRLPQQAITGQKRSRETSSSRGQRPGDSATTTKPAKEEREGNNPPREEKKSGIQAAVDKGKKRAAGESTAPPTSKRQKAATNLGEGVTAARQGLPRDGDYGHGLSSRQEDGTEDEHVDAAFKVEPALNSIKTKSREMVAGQWPGSQAPVKGSRLLLKNYRRVCDECVKRRIRCSFATEPRPRGEDVTNLGLTCEQCQAGGKSCTTAKPKKKRGPEEGWALSPRLLEMLRRDDEQLLYRWCSSVLLSDHLVGEGFVGDNFDYLVSTKAIPLSEGWAETRLSKALRLKAKEQLPDTEVTGSAGTTIRITKTTDRRDPRYRLATDLLDRRQHVAGEEIRKQEIGLEVEIINAFNVKCARTHKTGTLASSSGTIPSLPLVDMMPPNGTARPAEIQSSPQEALEKKKTSISGDALDEDAVHDGGDCKTVQSPRERQQPPAASLPVTHTENTTTGTVLQAPPLQGDYGEDVTVQKGDSLVFPENSLGFDDLFGPEIDTGDFSGNGSSLFDLEADTTAMTGDTSTASWMDPSTELDFFSTPWDGALDCETLDF